MTNEYYWRSNEYYYRKQRKANKLSLSYRLFDIAIGLLAGIVNLLAVYYLSLWRW